MSTRIGLFTPVAKTKKHGHSTTTDYVEVGEVSELVNKLLGLGAKRVGLLRRDRLGTTHIEGNMFSPAELKHEHLSWLSAKPEQFETRGLYYDRNS